MPKFRPHDVMLFDQVELEFGIKPTPCPFCGSPRVGLYFTTATPHVTCADCQSDGPLAREGDQTDRRARAVELWNQRAQLALAEWVGHYFGLQRASNMWVVATDPATAVGFGMAINEIRRRLDAEMNAITKKLPPGTIDHWPRQVPKEPV